MLRMYSRSQMQKCDRQEITQRLESNLTEQEPHQEIPASYETRRFITLFRKACH